MAFNGVAAFVRSLTATTITTTVPPGATTGPLTVTTGQGTASRAFTVPTTADFALTVDPASVPAVQGTSVDLRVSAPASGSYTGLITLDTGSLPADVTAAFASPTLAPNRPRCCGLLRRVFTVEFKRQVVQQLLSGQKTLAELSRECDIDPIALRNWKRSYEAGAATGPAGVKGG